jgi:nucleoside-diphosphate-sugar epimerase
MRKTALVCGAGGFIGTHLVKKLKKDGYWFAWTLSIPSSP